MDWLLANWFWVVVAIAFVAMHLFGHGGHGGHGGHRRREPFDDAGPENRVGPIRGTSTPPSEHRH